MELIELFDQLVLAPYRHHPSSGIPRGSANPRKILPRLISERSSCGVKTAHLQQRFVNALRLVRAHGQLCKHGREHAAAEQKLTPRSVS